MHTHALSLSVKPGPYLAAKIWGEGGCVGTQERKSDPIRPLRAAVRAKDGAARVHWERKHTHAIEAPLWTLSHSLFGCSIHLTQSGERGPGTFCHVTCATSAIAESGLT